MIDNSIEIEIEVKLNDKTYLLLFYISYIYIIRCLYTFNYFFISYLSYQFIIVSYSELLFINFGSLYFASILVNYSKLKKFLWRWRDQVVANIKRDCSFIDQLLVNYWSRSWWTWWSFFWISVWRFPRHVGLASD